MPCDDCNLPECQATNPACTCDPPGGPGLIEPNNREFHGTAFHSWETGHTFACRIVDPAPDGLFADAIINYGKRKSERYGTRLPIVDSHHEDKKFRTVKAYKKERTEWLKILTKHMHAFAVVWNATGKPWPVGGFVKDIGRTGLYLPPYIAGFDCPAIVRKQNNGTANIYAIFESGNGYANLDGVKVLTTEAQLQQFMTNREVYAAARAPFRAAAEKEWAQHY